MNAEANLRCEFGIGKATALVIDGMATCTSREMVTERPRFLRTLGWTWICTSPVYPLNTEPVVNLRSALKHRLLNKFSVAATCRKLMAACGLHPDLPGTG